MRCSWGLLFSRLNMPISLSLFFMSFHAEKCSVSAFGKPWHFVRPNSRKKYLSALIFSKFLLSKGNNNNNNNNSAEKSERGKRYKKATRVWAVMYHWGQSGQYFPSVCGEIENRGADKLTSFAWAYFHHERMSRGDSKKLLAFWYSYKM